MLPNLQFNVDHPTARAYGAKGLSQNIVDLLNPAELNIEDREPKSHSLPLQASTSGALRGLAEVSTQAALPLSPQKPVLASSMQSSLRASVLLGNIACFDELEAFAETSPFPYLMTAVYSVHYILKQSESVKVYRESCRELGRQCVNLLLCLRHGAQAMDGTELQKAGDEVQTVVQRIKTRMTHWSSYSFYSSVFRQASVRDGIDLSYRELDHVMRVLSPSAHVEHSRTQEVLSVIQSVDNAEFRGMLQSLSQDITGLRSAVEKNPGDVPLLMQTLQEELHSPLLSARQGLDYRAVLRELHRETGLPPPLFDLTGQITDISPSAVAFGGSSDIHIGIWLDDEKVALKRHRAFNSSPSAQRKFLREIEIWRPLVHSNVLSLYGTITIGNHVSLVSPFMEKGNVREYLRDHPEVAVLPILPQIADGLEYLHSKDVVHGDIRGNNVLVSASGKPYISDFGLSKVQEHLEESSQSSFLPGSLRWTAPEIIEPSLIGLENASVSMNADVWSFGMLCLELISRAQPFRQMKSDFHVARAVVEGALPTRPTESPSLTDALWNFMLECWSRDPNERPSMRETSERLKRFARNIRGASIIVDYNPADETSLRNAPWPDKSPRTFGSRPSSATKGYGVRTNSSGGSVDSASASDWKGPLPGSTSNPHTAPTISHADQASSSGGSINSYYGHRTDPSTGSSSSSNVPRRSSVSRPDLSNNAYGLPSSPACTSNLPVTRRLSVSEQRAGHRARLPTPESSSKPSSAPLDVLDDVSMGTQYSELSSFPDPITLHMGPQHAEPIVKSQPARRSLTMQPTTVSSYPHAGPSSAQQYTQKVLPPMSIVSLPPPTHPDVKEEDYRFPVRSPDRSTVRSYTYSAAPPSPTSPPLPTPGSPGSENVSARPGKGSFWKLQKSSSKLSPEARTVFGRPLEEVLTYAGVAASVQGREPLCQVIPICVSKCGSWLKQYGLNEVAIFRKEGSEKRTKRLQNTFDQPNYGKHLDMKNDLSVADVATVLRKFMMELPVPLVPLDLYPQFLQMLKAKDKEQALQICHQLIEEMPPCCRDLLLYILDLISTFVKHSQNKDWRPFGSKRGTNMASLSELVRTFQPALLRHPAQYWWQGEEEKCCSTLVFMTERIDQILIARTALAVTTPVSDISSSS